MYARSIHAVIYLNFYKGKTVKTVIDTSLQLPMTTQQETKVTCLYHVSLRPNLNQLSYMEQQQKGVVYPVKSKTAHHLVFSKTSSKPVIFRAMEINTPSEF